MAQRDYVRRGQPSSARRKKGNSRKKQRSSQPAVSPMMVAIAAAVLVTFIGGLWFITHHKKEESETMPGQKVTGNGLPPKPEERWRYIKELESRQPQITQPTEPSAGGEPLNKNQLTDEQRQLLEQMQADMRQQPTQLNEVPWDEQTPAQRQQTLQRQQMQRQQQERQRQAQQRQQQQERQQRTAQSQTQPPYQEPSHPRNQAPKQQSAPIANETQAPKQTAASGDSRQWMVQCGSFRGASQAESVRAQLAFEGFSSHITTNNGWNRVVIGPIKSKQNVDSTLSRLKSAGHANCIRLSIRG
ncbi:cell division protein FtsN [Erwinia sp. CPCC 100877]|nr:cell division protein FtsN [Erwinia sp. CPCC 100877]